MKKDKIEFTEDQFQYLEHLKLLYDATNSKFINREFGDYIPVGIAIIHISTNTLESKYWDDPMMFNSKCINTGKLFYQLIYNIKMGLLDYSYNPVPSSEINLLINQIINYESYNYLNILSCFVSFEMLHNTLKELKNISSNDNRLKSVIQLWNGINDTNFKFNPEYVTNSILYNSIKNMRKKDKDKNNKRPTNEIADNQQENKVNKKQQEYENTIKSIKSNTNYNDDIKRVLIAEQHMIYKGFTIGCNLSEKGFVNHEAWFTELKNEFGKLFDRGRDNYIKYAALTWKSPNIKRRKKLHCFDRGTPKRKSKNTK